MLRVPVVPMGCRWRAGRFGLGAAAWSSPTIQSISRTTLSMPAAMAGVDAQVL